MIEYYIDKKQHKNGKECLINQSDILQIQKYILNYQKTKYSEKRPARINYPLIIQK